MKATCIYKDQLSAVIAVKFRVQAKHLEQAIIAIWVLGEAATKKRISEELHNMLFSGGDDAWANWVAEEYISEYHEKAKKHSQKLFPTFYKNNQ